MTPKLRIDIPDLLKYEHMLRSKSYHLICSPERCTEVLNNLKPLRLQKGDAEPVVVWEPIPDDCNPAHLARCVNILDQVDVLSPNAAECAAFFNENEPTDKENCERIGSKFLQYMTKNEHSGIVLRCGSLGCLCLTQKSKKWFPAYHSDPNATDYKVIDPTGCGNSFVGAFAAAYVLGGFNFDLGCVFGTLASGLCIQLHGVPNVEKHGDDELWNGVSLEDLLNIYLKRNPSLGITNDHIIDTIRNFHY
ncbi:unnamed protein product [Ambrosiozyma monospora]|uniref:Unnamed protein product n=1 Tax=Ambrosiozyma monospora TaxID=43982 RepID=A0A9W7DMQ0_AMBMO|nr:unnamed protein product [Ambrosiozyma monospora]